MYEGRSILAVVPARSGSKGVADKNIQRVGGRSLIEWAALAVNGVPMIDARVISTDSSKYAAEGDRYGLGAFFLRPADISSDRASAVDTMLHALVQSEAHYNTTYDIIVIVEPTSPLRTADDIAACIRKLVDSDADSVVTVSPLNPKWHPDKLLLTNAGRLGYSTPKGATIVGRQDLNGEFCWRNGACYCLRRETLVTKRAIITDHSVAHMITRVMINIDEPLELAFCDFLMRSNLVGVE
jgi:CMP-N,N'-diacetyllegionaminic acid synthase